MPIHPVAHAELTILSEQARLIILRDQVIQVVVGFENHIAAASAITSARSTFGTILFALECDAPFAAMACASIDFDFVNEHRSERSSAGTSTESVLPHRSLRCFLSCRSGLILPAR